MGHAARSGGVPEGDLRLCFCPTQAPRPRTRRESRSLNTCPSEFPALVNLLSSSADLIG